MFILVSTQALLIWLPSSISLAALLWAVTTAPWRQLLAKSIRQHLLFGALIALGVFWSFVSVNVNQVYSIHPLMITSVVFIFGLRFSLLIGALSLLVTHSVSLPHWGTLGYHYLINVVTPALVSAGVLLVIARLQIQNLFLYTLGGSFFGSMLAALSVGGVSLLSLWLADSTLFLPVWDNAYIFALLTFPEGFSNGAIISSLAILRPDLVKTYDDDFYLDGKGSSPKD